jgi:hypothetical protein
MLCVCGKVRDIMSRVDPHAIASERRSVLASGVKAPCFARAQLGSESGKCSSCAQVDVQLLMLHYPCLSGECVPPELISNSSSTPGVETQESLLWYLDGGPDWARKTLDTTLVAVEIAAGKVLRNMLLTK